MVVATVIPVAWFLLFYRPLVGSSSWRATITPLSSIMGSGFLVCAPLLYVNIGNYAVLGMAVLLILAYGVGSVIRFNIRHGEPLLEGRGAAEDCQRSEHRLHTGHHRAGHRIGVASAAELVEKVSHLALTAAYCISVSYYLQLLAGFALQPLNLEAAWLAKSLTTGILVSIAALGAVRGLEGIERMERVVVGVNLALVAALITSLLYHNAAAAVQGGWHLRALPLPDDRWHMVRLLMGMLIVVQGFETSRFLGHEHPAEQRIRTMRQAQIISSVIYLVFLALMALVVNESGPLAGDAGITAIVHLAGVVAPILPLLITVTALGSQLAAATADDAGCAGLLESFIKRSLSSRWNYVMVSGAAVALTWLTDVYEIISFASRAFALFYALQCLVAVLVALKTRGLSRRPARLLLFGALGVFCLGITVLGIPAG